MGVDGEKADKTNRVASAFTWVALGAMKKRPTRPRKILRKRINGSLEMIGAGGFATICMHVARCVVKKGLE